MNFKFVCLVQITTSLHYDHCVQLLDISFDRPRTNFDSKSWDQFRMLSVLAFNKTMISTLPCRPQLRYSEFTKNKRKHVLIFPRWGKVNSSVTTLLYTDK